jgi:hypothetical protein
MRPTRAAGVARFDPAFLHGVRHSARYVPGMSVFVTVMIPALAAAFAGITVWQARMNKRSDKQRDGEERRRWKRERLRQIARRAQQIRSDAMQATRAAVARGDDPSDTWRSANQELLAGDLVGVPDLPRCLSLTQTKGIGTVVAAALAAEAEVQAAFRQLQNETGR